MKRRIFALLLALCLVFGLTVPAYAEVSATEIRHSVVCVEIGFEGSAGYLDWSTGTGFFVGENGTDPQFLLTNQHVVDSFIYWGSGERKQTSFEAFATWMLEEFDISLSDLDEDTADWLLSYFAQLWKSIVGTSSSGYLRARIRIYYDNNDYEEGFLVDSDSIRDMALLRLAKPTEKRAPMKLTVPSEEMVTKTVYSVGYPGIADNEYHESITQRGESDATVNTGTVSRLLVETGTGVSTIQTDAVISHGNSGGPLVFENSAAIGINSWSVSNSSDQEKVFYALSMEEVIPMLNRNNVSYELAEWPEPEPEPEPEPGAQIPWLWIGIGAAVLAAVIIVAVVISKQKSGKKAAPAAETAAATSMPVAPAARPADPNDSGFRVQAVSGTLQGKRYMIRTGSPVVLGRNPQECGVVFPEGTPGVSGRHCEVRVENGAVYLRDLGSTHGTFLAPGSRLAAEQPIQLKEGDVFWLGSEKESFTIARKRA